MLNKNLMIGMEVEILKPCNRLGEESTYALTKPYIGIVKKHVDKDVFVLSGKSNYIIGENVRLIKLPTPESIILAEKLEKRNM